jgi:hypothetical protein
VIVAHRIQLLPKTARRRICNEQEGEAKLQAEVVALRVSEAPESEKATILLESRIDGPIGELSDGAFTIRGFRSGQ